MIVHYFSLCMLKQVYFTVKMRDMINIDKMMSIPYSRLKTAPDKYVPVIAQGCCLYAHSSRWIATSRTETFSDLIEWRRDRGGGGVEEGGKGRERFYQESKEGKFVAIGLYCKVKRQKMSFYTVRYASCNIKLQHRKRWNCGDSVQCDNFTVIQKTLTWAICNSRTSHDWRIHWKLSS
jgi:hypothetical protein